MKLWDPAFPPAVVAYPLDTGVSPTDKFLKLNARSRRAVDYRGRVLEYFQKKNSNKTSQMNSNNHSTFKKITRNSRAQRTWGPSSPCLPLGPQNNLDSRLHILVSLPVNSVLIGQPRPGLTRESLIVQHIATVNCKRQCYSRQHKLTARCLTRVNHVTVEILQFYVSDRITSKLLPW